VALGCAAVAVVAALVVAASGWSEGDDGSAVPRATQPARHHATADLPVYTRPIADASGARAETPELARRGAYYSEARPIATAYGRGYVVPAPDGWTCLVVPARPEGYGEGCASAAQIAERGLPVANVGFEDGGIMAAVLPPTATDATLHLADGTGHPLPIDDGVISAAASGKAKVTFRIADRPFTIKLYNDIRCVEGDPSYTRQELERIAERMGTRVC
jgi:hypothetical protein